MVDGSKRLGSSEYSSSSRTRQRFSPRNYSDTRRDACIKLVFYNFAAVAVVAVPAPHAPIAVAQTRTLVFGSFLFPLSLLCHRRAPIVLARLMLLPC